MSRTSTVRLTAQFTPADASRVSEPEEQVPSWAKKMLYARRRALLYELEEIEKLLDIKRKG